jgi:hypothetical protein
MNAVFAPTDDVFVNIVPVHTISPQPRVDACRRVTKISPCMKMRTGEIATIGRLSLGGDMGSVVGGCYRIERQVPAR